MNTWSPAARIWVGFCLVLAALPVVQWVARTWLDGMLGGAGAGILTLPVCAMLAGLAHRRPRPATAPRPSWSAPWGIVLATAGLYAAGALLALRTPEGWMLAGIALPPLFFAWLWGTAGAAVAWRYSFPVFFSYFALPWELFLRELDSTLQIASANLAYGLLHLLGYDVVWWNPYTFYDFDFYLIVNEACSGLNMLVTLAMYTLVFGWVTLPTLPKRAALLALVAPLALLSNGARVAAIWLMGKYGGNDLAMGFWHTGSAYLIFLPVFWVLYRVSRALGGGPRGAVRPLAKEEPPH